ncbi:MAG: hypothetical protein ACFFD4_04440 [Candidatus Odinarchaeota archaeon]
MKMEALRPFKSNSTASAKKGLYRWYDFHCRHTGTGNRYPAEPFQQRHRRDGRSFPSDLLEKDFAATTLLVEYGNSSVKIGNSYCTKGIDYRVSEIRPLKPSIRPMIIRSLVDDHLPLKGQ